MARTFRPATMVLVGWGMVVVLGVLVLLARDAGGALFVVAGLAAGAWVALRPSTPAFVASVVLGVLVVAEQTGYLIAGIGDGKSDGATIAADALGLIGGLLVTVGAVLALVRRRRPVSV
jgi:hypothetical protein